MSLASFTFIAMSLRTAIHIVVISVAVVYELLPHAPHFVPKQLLYRPPARLLSCMIHIPYLLGAAVKVCCFERIQCFFSYYISYSLVDSFDMIRITYLCTILGILLYRVSHIPLWLTSL